MKETLGGTAVLQNSDSEFFLEYYLVEDNDSHYGVKIEKMEREDGDWILREDYVSGYGIDKVDKASDVLNSFIKNGVTPVTADCILHDLGYFNL